MNVSLSYCVRELERRAHTWGSAWILLCVQDLRRIQFQPCVQGTNALLKAQNVVYNHLHSTSERSTRDSDTPERDISCCEIISSLREMSELSLLDFELTKTACGVLRPMLCKRMEMKLLSVNDLVFSAEVSLSCEAFYANSLARRIIEYLVEHRGHQLTLSHFASILSVYRKTNLEREESPSNVGTLPNRFVHLLSRSLKTEKAVCALDYCKLLINATAFPELSENLSEGPAMQLLCRYCVDGINEMSNIDIWVEFLLTAVPRFPYLYVSSEIGNAMIRNFPNLKISELSLAQATNILEGILRLEWDEKTPANSRSMQILKAFVQDVRDASENGIVMNSKSGKKEDKRKTSRRDKTTLSESRFTAITLAFGVRVFAAPDEVLCNELFDFLINRNIEELSAFEFITLFREARRFPLFSQTRMVRLFDNLLGARFYRLQKEKMDVHSLLLLIELAGLYKTVNLAVIRCAAIHFQKLIPTMSPTILLRGGTSLLRFRVNVPELWADFSRRLWDFVLHPDTEGGGWAFDTFTLASASRLGVELHEMQLGVANRQALSLLEEAYYSRFSTLTLEGMPQAWDTLRYGQLGTVKRQQAGVQLLATLHNHLGIPWRESVRSSLSRTSTHAELPIASSSESHDKYKFSLDADTDILLCLRIIHGIVGCSKLLESSHVKDSILHLLKNNVQPKLKLVLAPLFVTLMRDVQFLEKVEETFPYLEDFQDNSLRLWERLSPPSRKDVIRGLLVLGASSTELASRFQS